MSAWFPASWQQFSSEQVPVYPNQESLHDVVGRLATFMPIVTPAEINQLRRYIKQASRGETFIVQGGDCAESFADISAPAVASKLTLLKKMGAILRSRWNRPVVYIGRMAGQYTKPRSSPMEIRNEISLPSYRGDLVNAAEFDALRRTPDPQRILEGYQHASKTLSYIHQYLDKYPDERFYTSHEALHLHYEQALTRKSSDGNWYNLSTHFPWVGMRTAFLDSPQVEFLRGVKNPIGIKIGADMSAGHLVHLIHQLNPFNEEGRIVLITRLGKDKVERRLPALIQAIQSVQSSVAWFCDPMHGNAEFTDDGIKTRHFDAIIEELERTIMIHYAEGSHLSGVHLELTGDNVTECLGGPQQLSPSDLKRCYKSLVDPRLNERQALEVAKQLSQILVDARCTL